MITAQDLELAALAAGMTPVRMSDDGRGLLVAEQAEPWCPHTDPSSAARLAHNVRAVMSYRYRRAALASCDWGDVSYEIAHDGSAAGAEHAMCEAITLCAAAIGRRMQESSR